jgi:hypothetical protein
MDNQSKPIGRPKVPLCDRRRNIVKSVLNDDDYEALLALAADYQMTISDIIREGIERVVKEGI